MSLLPSQCRAGRALVSWSQEELAKAARVGKSTIANFEAGRSKTYDRTLDDVRVALETAGIEFLQDGDASPAGGAGVRLKATGPT